MAGKEETPKCRKKIVTWTNEMIEDLIDFIEIHPIVDLFLELNLLRTTIVHNNAIQRAAPSFPPKNAILFVASPAKTCVYSSKFLASCIHKLEFKFLDPSFLEWRLGCKTCIVYTGLNDSFI